jgi:hypothetical protein
LYGYDSDEESEPEYILVKTANVKKPLDQLQKRRHFSGHKEG